MIRFEHSVFALPFALTGAPVPVPSGTPVPVPSAGPAEYASTSSFGGSSSP